MLWKYGGRYFGFAMVGLAISSFVDASLRSFSFALRQSQLTGTMAAMLQTGCPLPIIVAGSALYPLLLAVARVGLFLGLAVGIFGVSIHQASPGPLLVSSLLTFGSTLVLGPALWFALNKAIPSPQLFQACLGLSPGGVSQRDPPRTDWRGGRVPAPDALHASGSAFPSSRMHLERGCALIALPGIFLSAGSARQLHLVLPMPSFSQKSRGTFALLSENGCARFEMKWTA